MWNYVLMFILILLTVFIGMTLWNFYHRYLNKTKSKSCHFKTLHFKSGGSLVVDKHYPFYIGDKIRYINDQNQYVIDIIVKIEDDDSAN